MDKEYMPEIFRQLHQLGCIEESDVLNTQDGFYFVYKSLSDILAQKGIFDFSGSSGARLLCNRFFDDWFLYAVTGESGCAYSLIKLREQEHDSEDGGAADGDIPGVTISFISFACEILLNCLENPADKNRTNLDIEINRVVARRGQCHHRDLKRYFIDPKSEGAYLVADIYVKHIASFATTGCVNVPQRYSEIVKQSDACRNSGKLARLPRFIASLNQAAGCTVCDNDKIYIKNREEPTVYESAAILATHAGNTSRYSFAAEVEYHARFLTPLAKMKIPFFGRSAYDSAIRADMSVGDTEFQGPAPFYRAESRIVKRQQMLHQQK